MRTAIRTPSFFDLYSKGEATADDIDDFVGRWHENQEPWALAMSLHEYLGLSREEYEIWLYDPLSLPCILEARQARRSLVNIMAERYEQLRAANRPEHATIIFSLGHWLKTKSRH